MISNNNNNQNNSSTTTTTTINFGKTGKSFEIPILHIPLTDDQLYCQSFSLTDSDEEVLNFFNLYGFVVFDNVLTKEETQNTLNDIYQILSDGTNGQFDSQNINTWNCWPTQTGVESFGTVSTPSIFSRQFMMNRQNENVIQAFSKVFQLPMTELIMSHDRASFYRPPSINNKWKTKVNVHLDLNPVEALDEPENATRSLEELNRLHYSGSGHWIEENNHICIKRDGLQVQALINLNDNLQQDGGFVCVPGFHNHFREFFENSNLINEYGRVRPRFVFQKNDAVLGGGTIYQMAQRVPLKAGSLIIWNQLLPHGGFYMEMNSTAKFRSAMYLRMFPKSMLLKDGASKRRQQRREGLRRKIQNLYEKEGIPLELTHLGRSVFDIEDDNLEEDDQGNNSTISINI